MKCETACTPASAISDVKALAYVVLRLYQVLEVAPLAWQIFSGFSGWQELPSAAFSFLPNPYLLNVVHQDHMHKLCHQARLVATGQRLGAHEL